MGIKAKRPLAHWILLFTCTAMPAYSAQDMAIPDALSFAAVDDLIREREVIIPEGAEWRFFRGVEEPSAGLAWTTLDFDDSLWEKGKSGFGYGDDDDATILEDMRNTYSTFYVRRVFELPDLSAWKRFVLTIKVDDGCILYVNGKEIGRAMMEEAPDKVPFNALSTFQIKEPITPGDFSIDKALLKQGKNIVAIQAVNKELNSSDASLIPVLTGERAPDPKRDEQRFETFKQKVSGKEGGPEKYVTYFQGRILQRNGRHEEAISTFKALTQAEPRAPAPILQLSNALCAVNRKEAAEQCLRKALPAFTDKALWHRWFKICAVDLKWTTADFQKALSALPPDMAEEENGDAMGNDIRWAINELDKKGIMRINAGGAEYTGDDGIVWGKDCFYSRRDFAEHKASIIPDKNAPLYHTEHWVPVMLDNFPCYVIPLPCGRYSVTLHFAEVVWQDRFNRIFGLAMEGERILDRYDITAHGFGTVQKKTHWVDIKDGFLDINVFFIKDHPKISAIEIQMESKKAPAEYAMAALMASPHFLIMRKGEQQKLAVKGTTKQDALCFDLREVATYQSAHPKVAAVAEDGTLTAVGNGKTSITVTFKDVSANIPVLVQDHIDLGEIAAGGNGAGSPPPEGQIGIHSDTGAWMKERVYADIENTGDNPQAVASSDLIDSVFLITEEEQAINTDGITFAFNPGDAGQTTWDGILNGMQPGSTDCLFLPATGPVHKGLGLHSPAGITYDLKAMRKVHGSDKVKYFFTLAGKGIGLATRKGRLNAYIIASGRDRIIKSWQVLGATDGEKILSGRIPSSAEYLTFASGNAGNGSGWDHCAFCYAVVTGAPPVYDDAIEIILDKDPLYIGMTCQLSAHASVYPYGFRTNITDKVFFSAGDKRILKVTMDGKVTPLAEGKTDIKVFFRRLTGKKGVEVLSRYRQGAAQK